MAPARHSITSAAREGLAVSTLESAALACRSTLKSMMVFWVAATSPDAGSFEVVEHASRSDDQEMLTFPLIAAAAAGLVVCYWLIATNWHS